MSLPLWARIEDSLWSENTPILLNIAKANLEEGQNLVRIKWNQHWLSGKEKVICAVVSKESHAKQSSVKYKDPSLLISLKKVQQ